jgi:hypothetical protein
MVVCIKYLENLDSQIHGLYIITIDYKKHTNKILLHFKDFIWEKWHVIIMIIFHCLLGLVLSIELRVVEYIWA